VGRPAARSLHRPTRVVGKRETRQPPVIVSSEPHLSAYSSLAALSFLVDTGIGNRLSEREQAIYTPERGEGGEVTFRALGSRLRM